MKLTMQSFRFATSASKWTTYSSASKIRRSPGAQPALGGGQPASSGGQPNFKVINDAATNLNKSLTSIEETLYQTKEPEQPGSSELSNQAQ